jgi:hypothetical protein
MMRKFIRCTLVKILLQSACQCELNGRDKCMRNANKIVAGKVGDYLEGLGVDEGIILRFILKNSPLE